MSDSQSGDKMAPGTAFDNYGHLRRRNLEWSSDALTVFGD
jgi:hypothetical protein